MTGRVIQGSFLSGQPKLAIVQPRTAPPPIQAKTTARPPGPPATAFAVRSPGPPAPAFSGRPPAVPAFAGQQGTVQRHGAGGAFAVDAGALGLVSNGGRPLPEEVRGKMEAALGADFSSVRVHVGPQAGRIGAIAFTVGSDIYFTPGRYQPETIQGQQLLGHELAHVVQQRAGRVRNPLGSDIAVIQDRALEAEADRMGHRAAAEASRHVAQPKTAPGAVRMPMAGNGVRPGAQARRFVQRKVGFEFEFQLPLSRYVPGEEQQPASWDEQTGRNVYDQLRADIAKKGKYKQAERVRGHEMVIDRTTTDGWRVTADNTSRLGSHKANLEVVTIPFDTDSWSPMEVSRRIREAVRTMRVWIEGIMAAQPQVNRVRIPGTMYVVGFPPLNWTVPEKYATGLISTDAYVQINIGVPFNKVKKIAKLALAAGNQFTDTERLAAETAKKIVQRLQKVDLAAETDVKLLEGFFTLLASAVYGASMVTERGLLKKLWSLLPKTGLATWWSGAKNSLSDKCDWAKNPILIKRKKRDVSFKEIIELYVLGEMKGIKSGQPLLQAIPAKVLDEIASDSGIELFEKIRKYFVIQYITDVMTGKGDPLVELALQHKTETGAGSSMLALDAGRRQTLGVLEIRNINELWPLAQIEQKALEWAKQAYELTGGNWDLDLATERRIRTESFHATKAEMLLGRTEMYI